MPELRISVGHTNPSQQVYKKNQLDELISQIYFGMKFHGVPSWSCSKAVYKPVWHIPLLCVQWKTPDDGQRNCPKNVECHSKINLRN
jgi:hypothetical protein